MSDHSYTNILRKACKALSVILSHFLHLGRVTAPAQLELEEVDGQDSRALGNWKQDVFGRCYSTQLPLPAMRVMAGHDKRQGFHINPRTTYFGDDSHQHLPKMIFSWLDAEISKVDQVKNKTAAAFLSFLDSLRWVILQDAALLLSEGREHYIFENNPEIFKSEGFLDYQGKLILHIRSQQRDEEFNATLDTVLPGLHERLDNQNFALHNQCGKLDVMSNRVHGVIKNYTDFKELYMEEKKEHENKVKTMINVGICNVKDSIGNIVGSHVKSLCNHIGSYDLNENSTNVSQLMIDMEQEANNESEIVPYEPPIQQEITTTTAQDSNSNPNDQKVSPTLYTIPKYFDTFTSMLSHWYNIVKNKNDSRDKTWRKHLSAAEKKRFQRLACIIKAFQFQLAKGITVTDAEAQFEEFYKSNKKSLADLSDKYAKDILGNR